MLRGSDPRVCCQGVVYNQGGTAAPNWQCGLFGFFLLVLQQLYQSSYVFRGICLYHCHALCNCCNCPAAFAAVALCSCCVPTLLLQASSMHRQLTELMRGGGPKAATQVQSGLSHFGGGAGLHSLDCYPLHQLAAPHRYRQRVRRDACWWGGGADTCTTTVQGALV
jgi:hypothetical protein